MSLTFKINPATCEEENSKQCNLITRLDVSYAQVQTSKESSQRASLTPTACMNA